MIPRARARVWLLLYVCVCVCSSMCVYLVLIELRFINHMYLCAFVHMCPSSLPTRARVLIHCAGDGGSAAADSDTAHADRVGLGADALLRRHLLLCRHPKSVVSTHQSTQPSFTLGVRASVRVRMRMRAYLRARLHGLIVLLVCLHSGSVGKYDAALLQCARSSPIVSRIPSRRAAPGLATRVARALEAHCNQHCSRCGL